MKTLHTTTDHNVINNHARVRFVLTVAGIVVAVLCSLALWREVSSAERMNTSAPRLLKFSKVVATDFVGEVKTWMWSRLCKKVRVTRINDISKVFPLSTLIVIAESPVSGTLRE